MKTWPLSVPSFSRAAQPLPLTGSQSSCPSPGELSGGAAVPVTVPAVHPSLDRDEPEPARSVVAEPDESLGHQLDRLLVPKLHLGYAPRPDDAHLVTCALAASAIAGRCQGPPRPIAPTELSSPQARHPDRTGVQPALHHRHMTTGPTPTPRARARRGSARDPCRTGTRVRLVAGAAPAARLSGSGSRPSPSVPPRYSSPRSARRYSSTPSDTGERAPVHGDMRTRAAAVALRLPATGASFDRTARRPRHEDQPWATKTKNGSARAQRCATRRVGRRSG